MSLHLLFFKSHYEQNGFFPSQVWSDNPIYNHVELLIDNTHIVHQSRGQLVRFKQTEGERHYDLVRVRIPDRYQIQVIQNLNQLNLTVPYRMRDYKYAAINLHCPRSMLKTGFTCATIVAYLLGHPEYYSMSPDRIYNQLCDHN